MRADRRRRNTRRVGQKLAEKNVQMRLRQMQITYRLPDEEVPTVTGGASSFPPRPLLTNKKDKSG
ncbi:hypothetical protein DLM86_29090 [Paenibacillus flagellatus]|uniref:Uncharacterized protein n=1 Tax=Paenibacillus flagellatus TaxID=2211139 RepID=A0A2V5JVE6_9BACL|nr:hypothetical protein DLM86_29090 [Paenibacillus flagellatus]